MRKIATITIESAPMIPVDIAQSILFLLARLQSRIVGKKIMELIRDGPRLIAVVAWNGFDHT